MLYLLVKICFVKFLHKYFANLMKISTFAPLFENIENDKNKFA